ncbi:MAG: TOMM precursor leader peptide-binding protein [Thermosphaera sp.]|nr:TOMM precursor leader peptide-binding protein [Thermosphaera sp.]
MSKKFLRTLRLFISPFYKAIIVDPNEVYFTPGFRSAFSFSLRDDKETNILSKLINLLQTPHTFDEICKKLNIPPTRELELERVLQALYERGVLSSVEENPFFMYYKIQLKLEESKIRNKRVMVIGAGPLGSRIILSLAKMDLEKLIVLDDRRIRDPRIEGFLFPYLDHPEKETSYIQLLKSHVTRDLGNNIEYIEYKEGMLVDEKHLGKVIPEANLVIVAYESYRPYLFHIVNELCVEKKIPVFFVFVEGNVGVIGPFVIPRETACYSCVEISYDSIWGRSTIYRAYREHIKDLEERGEEIPLSGIPPLYDIVSGIAIDNVVRFIMDATPLLIGRLIFIEHEAFMISVEDALKNPRCPVCSNISTPRKSYI